MSIKNNLEKLNNYGINIRLIKSIECVNPLEMRRKIKEEFKTNFDLVGGSCIFR